MSFGVYRLFLIGIALADHARCWCCARIHALRRAGARRGRQPAHGARPRHRCRSASSRSPSRSAAGSPVSAARSPSRSSASITRSRFTYLVYVLIVVSVGGLGSIGGSFAAASAARHQRHGRQILLSGARRLPHLSRDGRAADVAAARPVREALTMASATAEPSRSATSQAQIRWRPLEIAFWLATLLPFVLAPELSVAREPDRHHRAVRALARSHPRLCRHRLARPCGVFRLRRLYRRADREMGLGRAAHRRCSLAGAAAGVLGYRRRASSSRASATSR